MTPVQAKQEIILHYTDIAGMVTIDKDPAVESTKNGLMQTGAFGVMCEELNLNTGKDRTELFEVIQSCQDEDNPGAFDRYPSVAGRPRVQDKNAHDDARGVCALSKMCGFHFHKVVLWEGVKRFFYYDNTNGKEHGFWAWRGRMVIDILWYVLLNDTLRILVMLFWPLLTPALMIVLYAKAGSGKYSEILDYMLVASMAKDSKVWKRFRKPYMKKNKIVEATSDYFKETSPMVILAKKVKEL